MRSAIVLLLFFFLVQLSAQEEEPAKFYIGVSYGTSNSVGDFGDTDITNPDAGYAENGTKLDIYGGKFINDKVTITGVFRYQKFESALEALIDTFNVANPGSSFSGSSEDWETYSILVGIAYRVGLSKKLNLFPRIGLGPMVARNPGLSLSAPNATITQNFSRTSETGFGLGYEIGIGLRTDLGRHFALMPTFTFSGGAITIPDVVTTTDNVQVTSDFQPKIQSFNFGLSLAYRFY